MTGGGLVADTATLDAVFRQCAEAPEVAFDTEARVAQRGKGLDLYHPDNHVSGFSVKAPGKPAWYISLRHPDSTNFPAALRRFWPAIRHKTLGHNSLVFDAIMLHLHEGLPLPDGGRDTLTMMPLENENLTGDSIHTGYSLKGWCARQFGPESIAGERALTRWAIERGLNPKSDIWKMPASAVAQYACDDVVLAERVAAHLDARFEQLGLTSLAREQNDYRRLLTEMEVAGLSIDWPLCEQYRAEAEGKAVDAKDRLCLLAGRFVNPASPLQMMKLLNVSSTEKWQIKRLVVQGNELAKALWSWRRWSKAASTFYSPFQRYRDGAVLHPAFRFIRTGRLSCFEPNFHATPHYSEEYKVKDVFTAPPGMDMVLFDWSQAELRLCAHYTQDPDMMQAFAEGRDLHQLVADELHLTRDTAKTINFGAAYGLGAEKMSRDLGCTKQEAKRWLDKYHARFTGPRTLYRRMGTLAERQRWIRMWDGRYRRFDMTRNFPRTASNSLLQGGVGGMARTAMLRLKRECPWLQQRLQIHDAILAYVPESTDRTDLLDVKRVMEDFDFRVKIPVEVKRGKTWGSLKTVRFEGGK